MFSIFFCKYSIKIIKKMFLVIHGLGMEPLKNRCILLLK